MSQDNYSGGAVALTTFASVILMIAGVFQSLAGLTAIVNDEVFITTEDYLVEGRHECLGLGTPAALASSCSSRGWVCLQGAVWARTVAVVLASLSAIANFLWLPVQPWWAIIMITLNIFIIWAVTAHGRDITKV